MTTDYGRLLVSQLEFYWDVHLRPRLDGLTDEEYLWEPADGCWSIRPDGSGGFRLDREPGRPDPAPITTIAWRIFHVATGMSTRTSTFFGGGPEADMFDPGHLPPELPGTAADGLTLLDTSYADWHDAISGLDAAALDEPLGWKGSFFAKDPMAALIVHVNREVMHHGGEICLLRDLYRAMSPAEPPPSAGSGLRP
jgi:DinB family protein